MRALFALLALVLLPFSLAAAEKASDTQGEQFLGPVRSVDSVMTRYYNESPQGEEPQQLDIITFDSKGNEIERTIYDDYGFLVGQQIIRRDADGHATERTLSDPKRVVLERFVYSYVDGRLAGIVGYDGKGKVAQRQVNAYDDAGRVREQSYFEGRKRVGWTSFKYDAEGRASEAAYYLGDGSKAVADIGPCFGAHRVTYAHDESGRPAKVVAYEPDGEEKKSWQYSYNPQGYMAEEITDDHWSRRTSVFSYEYDSYGNWIKRVAAISEERKDSAYTSAELAGMGSSRSRTVHSRKIAYY